LVVKFNREMYDCFRLKDLDAGVIPQKREIVVKQGITNSDIQQAVNSLVHLDVKKKRKHKKKNKKSKSKFY